MYNYVLVIIEILLLHARDAKKPHATPRALCIGCAVPGAPLPTSPHRFPDGTNNEGYVKRTSFSTRKWHRSCGCHRRNGATGVERRLSSIIRYIIPSAFRADSLVRFSLFFFFLTLVAVQENLIFAKQRASQWVVDVVVVVIGVLQKCAKAVLRIPRANACRLKYYVRNLTHM